MSRYLLLYLRNIKNNPKLFLINITSFSFGIVAVMFLFLFVVKEFNADKFHKNHDDIYRVVQNRTNAPSKMTMTAFPLGNLLMKNHSEIQDYTRFIDVQNYVICINELTFTDQNINFVDRSFFNMFDFKMDAGDYNEVFENPNTVIIDCEKAKRYFNSTDVLGKTIEIEQPGIEEKKEFTIVGILSGYSDQSTLQPHIIANIASKENKYIDNFFNSSPQLFLYIPKCDNIEKLSERIAESYFGKLNELRAQFGSKQYEIDNKRMYLQRLTEVYLHSPEMEDKLPKGNFMLVRVLICVGFVMLIITFVNYIILNLGIGLKNQKQNQIHRILGGSSGWLKRKFVTESVFYTFITFVTALLLLPIVHRIMVHFFDYRYSLFSTSNIIIILSFLLLLIMLGISSGYVQYIVLVFRKKSEKDLSNFTIRKSFLKYLVPFQLFVFITTITAVVLITRQIHFIKEQNLGYDIKNTITVLTDGYEDKKIFIQEFENKTNVNYVSVGHTLHRLTPYLNKVTIDNSKKEINAQTIFGDQNYIKAYNIELLYGTNINGGKLPPVDEYYSYVHENVVDVLVNEEFVRKLGLKDPLGTLVSINHNGTSKGIIVGVIEDVKNLPFYRSVTPMVIGYGFSHGPEIVVSVKEGQMAEFKKDVDSFFHKMGKENYWNCSTWSYDFERWYQKEQTLMLLLSVFSVKILFILILGLVGISIFISERKTKEIGIRKVNGAKVSEILSMLNMDFVKWVVVAFIVSTPVSYLIMYQWLQNFAYRTRLSWWVFMSAGIFALLIAMLTVSWQSWRAARRNPVEALRYE